MKQLAESQASPQIPINENFAVLAPLACYGFKYDTASGLIWAYYGGRWGGFLIADGSVTLGASTTSYLVVEIATGALTASTATTHWNDATNYLRVYKIVTGANSVTSFEDHRGGPGGVLGGAGGGGGGGGDALTTNPLSQFAATTSAQLAGVLSDETGFSTGAVSVFSISPALTGTPTVPTAGAGTSTTQAASTAFVGTAIATALDGRAWKQPVRAATTANGTLATAFANGQTIDGVTLATGDRILLKNQTTGSENGIYVVAASGAPTRATDADAGAELVDASVYVSEGTAQADQQWTCTTNAPITVGSTSLTFTQSGSGASGVTSVAASVPSFLSVAGSPITTTGTLAITLSGTALPAVNGGTGQTSFVIGDLFYANTTTTLAKLAIGSNGNVLAVVAGLPAWSASAGAGTVTSVAASGGLQTTSGSPITSTGTVQAALVRNAQTGTSYTIVAGDRGKNLAISNAASVAVGIAQASSAGFEDGWFVFIENQGVGAVTITPTTSTINGNATLVLTAGEWAILIADSSAQYRAILIERPGHAVNAQTSTTYTVLSGDRAKLVSHSNVAAIAVTLPQATGAFGAGWYAWIQNRGAGTATYTPTTSTIDGAASLALTTGQGVLIASDGTNYYTSRGAAASAGAGLTAFTDALNTTSPNNSINASSLTASGGSTNQGLILKWKGGNGYIAVQTPDATAAAGNVRGAGAVDFSSSRSAASQVAAGIRSFMAAADASTASGQTAAVIASDNGSSAAGDKGVVIAATVGTNAGTNSLVTGSNPNDYGVSQAQVFGGGSGYQRAQFIGTRNSVFSTTPVAITVAGGAPSATNIPILPNNTILAFTVRVIVSGGGDYWDQEIKGTITRGSSAGTTAILGTPVQTTYGKTAGATTKAWTITVTADTTNGGLLINFSGDAGGVVQGRAYFTLYLTN